jgi:hypothetical protein
MSRYTVVWDADVESAFIEAWIAGDSDARALLTLIAQLVDSNLATIPTKRALPGSTRASEFGPCLSPTRPHVSQ